MSPFQTESSADSSAIDFDEGLYPKSAVLGAAYIFIDRCYVHLSRPGDQRIRVVLARKPGSEVEISALAGEFQNELLGQAWRHLIIEENRELIQQVSTQALAGAAGPPGLEELMDMDIGEETAFEDPLGIAMSWEDKYKKKKKKPGEASDEESGS